MAFHRSYGTFHFHGALAWPCGRSCLRNRKNGGSTSGRLADDEDDPALRSPKKSNVLLDAGAVGLEGLVEVELKSDSKVSSTGFELVLILLPPD